MSASLRLAFLALALLSASTARADGLASGFQAHYYSYELIGLDALSGRVLVAYPVLCDYRTGEPLAAEVADAEGELPALVDYEIVRPGRRHRAAYHCRESRLYVVDVTGLKVEPTAPLPGEGEGERDGLHIAAIDALGADGRSKFFRADPRVRDTGFVLERDSVVPSGDPLRSFHDVLELARVGEEFRVHGLQVTYTYRDGTREILAYVDGLRPQPAGKGNLPPDPSFIPEPESLPPPVDTADENFAGGPPALPGSDESPAWLWPLVVALLVIAGLVGVRLGRRRASAGSQ
ncbi:hypothetical protein [Nannocystis punicea]|uniref:MYXO-CTERM domain-containing protein n=1 Tax=Nannocystis punicea TaxID=2995304 RepID=A0ABY7GZS5_9BACT|nr:hypothetical protein [Nannocystis poenicansa]WAS92491.1 hypothetical protein O0S08_40445 [Nannocystis poenicansa]